ncbi:GNAT family N-acetyltransferase [Komagataeibacter saccharivorans]|uniref:GNAT family N-acetyltransferase n=1 Tax=Komagataeibacter saccharivorans TaxID=265959 RepID=UPI000D7BA93A|nr:GNAT family N-acetyltransferase [Komagataeibacter saccharivorans]PYD50511.1 GNAT family N-acetyltransferase [Komagataeibacter saccharivorans]GBQ38571.1 N-acetyltransferase GCN5 [Komagataeibacter saccharivorans NRIC 0614]
MIGTARLTLSYHTRADFDDVHAMWSDPAVVRFINGRPLSEQESWFRLLRYRGLWDLLGYGYWCVRTKADGRYVGDVGFGNFHRPIKPALGDTPEAGWVLASWAHGQGFATEALISMLDWMDNVRGIDRTVCLVAPENAPSVRVAEKGGYRLLREVLFDDEPTLLLERVKPEKRPVS